MRMVVIKTSLIITAMVACLFFKYVDSCKYTHYTKFAFIVSSHV